ncbi:MAG: hypothetical protein QGG12_03235 [Prochlorococcaceae cyanobacterium ETNP18_MAG_14]|nr:hypothetical protein [Prochlorococcaceae cyanobacterium ETNP18_MAG_14]
MRFNLSSPLGPPLQALARGFQLGIEADLVVAYKLEEGREQPLVQWREELKLHQPQLN